MAKHVVSRLTSVGRIKAKYRQMYRRYMSDSHVKDILRHYKERDPKENQDSTPPDHEFVDLICLWAVEFYTPAHTDDLVDNLKRLGWGDGDSRGDSSNPIAWVEGLRRHHYGVGWMNLGMLTPRESEPVIGGLSHNVHLPSNVKYALAGIYSLTPSLIGVVVCFVFEEPSSGLFDKTFRADRSTYVTRTGTGWRFHGPADQKRDGVTQIRADLSQLAADWFSKNLPGLFSSGLLNGEIPTCELIATRVAEPFPSHTSGARHLFEYSGLLGIGRALDIWQHKDDSGLKLKLPDDGERGPRYHAILAIRESNANGCQGNDVANQTTRDKLHELDLVIPNCLSVWAILPMLEGYTKHIKQIRDSTTLRPKKSKDAVRILETLRSHVSYSVDIAAVAAELATSRDALSNFNFLAGEFKARPEGSSPSKSLDWYLTRGIRDRANWLLRTDRALRDQLTQYGSLLGTAENVRLQKTIGCLTWVLVVFGVATILMSGLALTQTPWFHGAIEILRKFFAIA